MADKIPALGKYEVWHRTVDGYEPAASVQATSLLAATVLTMERKDTRWQDGEGVVAFIPQGRGTDMGDVIVNLEGVAYQIAETRFGFAFDMIDFPQHQEHKALISEMTADYAAAKARDGNLTLAEILNSPFERSKPEASKAQEIDRGHEHER